MKIGNWKFVKSSKVLQFKSGKYTYEVDLERDNVDKWANHLRETKSLVMSSTDVDDMVVLWNLVVPKGT